MNLGQLLREAWRITRSSPALWLLNTLMFVTAAPALLLVSGISWLAATMAFPVAGFQPDWVEALRAWPTGTWVPIWIVAFMLMVLTSALTWLFQAGIIHGSALAAERGTPAPLKESLQLGWPRVRRVLGLSLTFGTLITALGLLPVALSFFVMQGAGPRSLAALTQAGQGALGVFNSAAGIALFLVLMSVAVEDVRARHAPGRAWTVFRKGWWAFLFVVALSAVPAVLLAMLSVPLIVLAPLTVLDPNLGGVLLGGTCLLLGPVGLAVMLFFAVFTTTLYTLIYRAAAQLADAARATPALPGT